MRLSAFAGAAQLYAAPLAFANKLRLARSGFRVTRRVPSCAGRLRLRGAVQSCTALLGLLDFAMNSQSRTAVLTLALIISLVPPVTHGAELAAARLAQSVPASVPALSMYDVRAFGAKGDGQTLDTDAINNAIQAASAAGGGTVHFSAGRYLSFSIRLKSHVTLWLDTGAVLVAADPAKDKGHYDTPEPNQWDLYQDFGHSHWQNSLIWGIDLEDIAIVGLGLIDGHGLTRSGPGARWSKKAGDRPVSMGPAPTAAAGAGASAGAGGAGGRATADPEAAQRRMDGLGNKAIALKHCRNVTLKDFSVLNGGHFALLATGVDNLTIDNLKVDTNRDGFDIDACRNVRISNSSVNSPNDDAIVLKTTFALGEAKPTEDVTITNCHVSGYDVGTMLDGTFKRTQHAAPDRDGATGRIKLGTESNGSFRNITISNCVFDRSRGFALETVDGGLLEDITVTNLTMRDVTTAPLFLRVGNRARGPEGTPIGAMRRIVISNITAYNAEPRYASIIAGLPGHPIEDVTISNVRILYRGGGTAEDAAREVPEREDTYPEPSMFGTLPAYGLFVRHARNVTLRDVAVGVMADDARPPVVLQDVQGIRFDHVDAPRGANVPFAVLRDVSDLVLRDVQGVADLRREHVDRDTVR
jgi:polygalacturonase